MQRNLSFRGKGKAQLAQPQMIIGRERDEKEEAESENGESHLDLILLAGCSPSCSVRWFSLSGLALPPPSPPRRRLPIPFIPDLCRDGPFFLLSPNGRSDQAAFGLRLRQGVADLTLQ